MIRLALIDGPLDGPETPARLHATAMVRAIRRAGAAVEIQCFPVFDGGLSTSLDRLIRALAVARAAAPQIVHCSLGLPRAAVPLDAALEALLDTGALVVAARPARGLRPIWPAAHPSVFAVQGDARCGAPDHTALDPAQRWFGACPALPAPDAMAGASIAAAHFSGLLAADLERGGDPATVASRLAATARFHGRERRREPAPEGSLAGRQADSG
ncbi:hypothetical protein [Tropicimonas sp. IMCC34043]|uniref:hypothetical protein n=1 Tax=Tropicimonas sp. IMCC34043 TaxID=2248760 RepID=UPI000E22AAE8|nr:hypothetical protein [Tropicimonas sp. IMCC34043]